MPRAEWNTVAVFTYGPCHPWAGDPSYVGPARWVPADGIRIHGSFTPNITGWLTYGTVPSRGMWIPTLLGVNPNLSDRVYWGGSLAPTHWTVFTERVTWGGDDYFRSSLAPLPVPPFVNCGGIESACYSGSGPCVLPTGDLVLDWPDLEDGVCDECSLFDGLVITKLPGLGEWGVHVFACGGDFELGLHISEAGGILQLNGPYFTDVNWTFTGCFSSPQHLTFYSGGSTACGFTQGTPTLRLP